MKTETIVFFRYEDLKPPVLKVVDGGSDVTIAIRSENDEHLSLHESDDGPWFTHWSPDKPGSTWDCLRVSTARSVGWRDPDRHAHYFSNRPLFAEPIDGMDGHELVSRYVDLGSARPKARYERANKIELGAPGPEFMLGIHLSTRGQPVREPSAPHVQTRFGDLHFKPTPWPSGPMNA
jgi:hypothetical protein